MGALFQALNITPRALTFRDTKGDCAEAGAVWDQLSLGASYEVSPLIGGDSDWPYAWQATLYGDANCGNGADVDPECDEYGTKLAAIAACQEHNRLRVIAMIEEMIQ